MPLEKPLLHALDRMRLGGIILDGAGHILEVNETALENLQQQEGRGTTLVELREQLKTLLRRGNRRFSIEKESWIGIPREGKRPLVVRALPVGRPQDPYSRTVIILIDLDVYPQPTVTAVQMMFGLSEAEADLALRLSCGASASDVARDKGVKLSTVRSQLASIFAKTQTTRQTDLVALLNRVAILP